tara:strand:- start:377 stop:1075 length:699 start_codon:yes stop_codon:yes gene_type:complete
MWQIFAFIIMKIIRIKIVFFFILFSTVSVFSQTDNISEDIQVWNGLELKYKGVKKTEFVFEGGIRFVDNATVVGKYFSDLSIKRKYNDIFSYSVGYRYLLNKNNDLVFEAKNRFYGDIRFKQDVTNRVSVSFRTRLQKQIDSDFSVSRQIKNKFREKIKCTYDWKNLDLDIFIGCELFYLFDEGVEKIRYIAGLEKSFGKRIGVGFDSMFQNDLLDSEASLFVFRTTLSYTI